MGTYSLDNSIAEALNFAVRQKAQKLNKDISVEAGKRGKEIVRLRNGGMTFNAIAKLFRFSESRAIQLYNKYKKI